MYSVEELFDLNHTLAGEYLKDFKYPWEALAGISGLILKLGESLGDDYLTPAAGVWVHKTAKIAPTAYIGAPCIIGAGTEVRHCAFIRGSALVGEGCVIGNSTELKNVIISDGAQIPHFNYVGDSILGYKSHMGAGAITSNVKADKTPICVNFCGESKPTGLKKVGAFIGDFAEIGCNSVLNPGTVIGRGAIVYPLSSVRGAIKSNCIYKREGVIVPKK